MHSADEHVPVMTDTTDTPFTPTILAGVPLKLASRLPLNQPAKTRMLISAKKSTVPSAVQALCTTTPWLQGARHCSKTVLIHGQQPTFAPYFAPGAARKVALRAGSLKFLQTCAGLDLCATYLRLHGFLLVQYVSFCAVKHLPGHPTIRRRTKIS